MLDNIHRVDFAGYVEFYQFHEMLPVVLGSAAALRAKGTHVEQSCLELGRAASHTILTRPHLPGA